MALKQSINYIDSHTLFNVTPPVIAPPSSKYRNFNAPRKSLDIFQTKIH